MNATMQSRVWTVAVLAVLVFSPTRAKAATGILADVQDSIQSLERDVGFLKVAVGLLTAVVVIHLVATLLRRLGRGGAAEAVRCRKCGQDVPRGTRFCTNCGAEV